MPNFVPSKTITETEYRVAIKDNKNVSNDGDPMLNPIFLECGVLYRQLWALSEIAFSLAKKHLADQKDAKQLLAIFQQSGAKYVKKYFLPLAVELDTEKNLTTEKAMEVVQLFFEKIIIAVNEQIHMQKGEII